MAEGQFTEEEQRKRLEALAASLPGEVVSREEAFPKRKRSARSIAMHRAALEEARADREARGEAMAAPEFKVTRSPFAPRMGAGPVSRPAGTTGTPIFRASAPAEATASPAAAPTPVKPAAPRPPSEPASEAKVPSLAPFPVPAKPTLKAVAPTNPAAPIQGGASRPPAPAPAGGSGETFRPLSPFVRPAAPSATGGSASSEADKPASTGAAVPKIGAFSRPSDAPKPLIAPTPSGQSLPPKAPSAQETAPASPRSASSLGVPLTDILVPFNPLGKDAPKPDESPEGTAAGTSGPLFRVSATPKVVSGEARTSPAADQPASRPLRPLVAPSSAPAAPVAAKVPAAAAPIAPASAPKPARPVSPAAVGAVENPASAATAPIPKPAAPVAAVAKPTIEEPDVDAAPPVTLPFLILDAVAACIAITAAALIFANLG